MAAPLPATWLQTGWLAERFLAGGQPFPEDGESVAEKTGEPVYIFTNSSRGRVDSLPI